MKTILNIRRITVTLAATAAAVGFLLVSGPTLAGSDVLFTGGGIIKDGRAAAAKRISFSVNLFANADGISKGHLGFRFHNLDDSYGLDRSRFTASEFDSVLIETHYRDTTPYTFVRIEASGRLNGADGWSVLARFSDPLTTRHCRPSTRMRSESPCSIRVASRFMTPLLTTRASNRGGPCWTAATWRLI